MAVRVRAWRLGPPDSALALSAGVGTNLLHCILLACFPNSWTHRAKRSIAGERLSSSGRACLWSFFAILVCADPPVVFQRFANAREPLLGWNGGFYSRRLEHLFPRHVCRLFLVLSFLRQCGPRLLGISIRRHVARSRVHLDLLRPAWISARPRRYTSAFSRQSVLAAVGMVSNLLRVRGGQDPKR